LSSPLVLDRRARALSLYLLATKREYVEHKKKEAGGDGAVVKRLTE